jgi:hypothetical protein
MGIKYKDTALMPEFKNFPSVSSMAGISMGIAITEGYLPGNTLADV